MCTYVSKYARIYLAMCVVYSGCRYIWVGCTYVLDICIGCRYAFRYVLDVGMYWIYVCIGGSYVLDVSMYVVCSACRHVLDVGMYRI